MGGKAGGKAGGKFGNKKREGANRGLFKRRKARYQRQLTTAIKRARFLALMPYTDLHQ